MFDHTTIVVFVLVFVRIGALMFAAPFFGDRAIPRRHKAVLALVMSLIVTPVVPMAGFVPPTHVIAYVLLILRELLIGTLVGYAAHSMFAGIQLAGQVVSFQMGLALARAFDPSSGVQSTVVAVLYRWIGLLVFLAVNGHHYLIIGVAGTYGVIGLGEVTFDVSTLRIVLRLLGDIFRIAIQVAAPALVVLFFTKILLALMNRAIPQMHVFLVGLPLTLTVGFITIALSIGGIIQLYPKLFEQLWDSIDAIGRSLSS